MPRAKEVKPRPQYDQKEEVRKFLRELPLEKLQDKNGVVHHIRNKGIKIHGTALGKVRHEIIREVQGNGSSPSVIDDLEANLDIVLAAIRKCGGYDQFKRALRFVERAQGRS